MSEAPKETGPSTRPRETNGRWAKGVSGNPNGRPKGSQRAGFYAWAEGRLAGWLQLAEQMAEADPAMLRFLIEQTMGKAQQSIEHSGETTQKVETVYVDTPRPELRRVK